MLISRKKTVTALKKEQNDTGKNNKRTLILDKMTKVKWIEAKNTKNNLAKNVMHWKKIVELNRHIWK